MIYISSEKKKLTHADLGTDKKTSASMNSILVEEKEEKLYF
jgi:hypothetical protein